MREELSGCASLSFNRVNDPEGDCGTTLTLLFENEAVARGFIARLGEEGVGASTPIDSGRHVYVNWEPVMKRRGVHHPLRDPYRAEGVGVEYSRDSCPRTLDVLARTVYLATSATRSEADLRALVATVRRAARRAAGARGR